MESRRKGGGGFEYQLRGEISRKICSVVAFTDRKKINDFSGLGYILEILKKF